MKYFFLTLIYIVQNSCLAAPTSNVINALYSVDDNFFQKYGFPTITFADRVQLLEGGRHKTINSYELSSNNVFKKEIVNLQCQKNESSVLNTVYFWLIHDKVEKRHLLFAFLQPCIGNNLAPKQIDVFQYVDKPERSWQEIELYTLLPPFKWADFFANISDDALKLSEEMTPPVEFIFTASQSPLVVLAEDYLKNEKPEIWKYIENNTKGNKSLKLQWNKKTGKFESSEFKQNKM